MEATRSTIITVVNTRLADILAGKTSASEDLPAQHLAQKSIASIKISICFVQGPRCTHHLLSLSTEIT